jgi:transposase
MLKRVYQAERDPAVRTRLQGLWLLRSGRSLSEVAAVVGVHYRTVQRWTAWYRTGGVAKVRAHQLGGTGQVPFLSPAQEEAVAAEVQTGRFGTGEEIRAWIAEQFGAPYTLGGIYSLLKRVKCQRKVPRPVHAKTDRAAQEAWKKGASSRRSAMRV